MSEPMPSAKSEPEWAAFAAIDWADQKHFWRLVPAGSRQPEQGELENTPEAVEAWAAALQQRFGGRPIAVCLEQARGTLVAHLVLFPVPKRRKMSAAARKRIGDAQRKRWAESKKESAPPAPVAPEAPKPKRRLSAAGKKAISEATKKRWARVRAEAAKAAKAQQAPAAKQGAKKATAKKAPAKASRKAAKKVTAKRPQKAAASPATSPVATA